MNSRLKGPKRMVTKVPVAMLKKGDWHEDVWLPVVNRDKSHGIDLGDPISDR